MNFAKETARPDKDQTIIYVVHHHLPPTQTLGIHPHTAMLTKFAHAHISAQGYLEAQW